MLPPWQSRTDSLRFPTKFQLYRKGKEAMSPDDPRHVPDPFPDDEDDDIIEEPSGLDSDVETADDKTALAKRRGNTLLEPIVWWEKRDTMQTAGLVMQHWLEAKEKGEEPEAVYVDVIGIGAGVVDRLREQGLPVQGVNVSESPAIKERYPNQRSELWFRARDWFETRACRLPDPADFAGKESMGDLIDELSGVKFEIKSNGKQHAESKDDMKKRGLQSPNLADAFILTLAGSDLRTEATLHLDRYQRRALERQYQHAGSWMAS